MKNVVIVDSVRTGLAKSHRGGFNMTRPDEMLAHIIDAMLDRNPNLPPEEVEDIIMGCGNPEGAQGHNVGRNAAVLSKLPITTGGTTINRYCSSGLQSISMAAGQIMAGCYDTVIAGGAETISMMNMNMDNFVNERLANEVPGIYFPMGMTAEVVAKHMGLSEEKTAEISMALIEATINAFEHSESKSSNVEIHFIIQGDTLVIKVSDHGKGFDKSTVEIPNIEEKLSSDYKRGWGLQLIQELMDTVEFESTDDGTTVTMTKKK